MAGFNYNCPRWPRDRNVKRIPWKKLFRALVFLSWKISYAHRCKNVFFFLEFHIDGENIPRGFRFLLSFCYSILIFLFFTWVIENEMEFKRLNTIARFTEVSVYINSWFILIWSSKINILWIREIKFMHIHLDCLKY